MAVGALFMRRVILPILIGGLASGRALSDDASRAQHRYSGLPLVQALDELRSRGLRLIYTSELARPGLMIETEPSATAPREILDQLLTPFGLEARDGPGGTLLIVGSVIANQPEGSLEGLVRTQSDETPVAGAQILVAGTGVTTVSRGDGGFFIPHLALGTCTLEVRGRSFPVQRFEGITIMQHRSSKVVLEIVMPPAFREKVTVSPAPPLPGGDQPGTRETLNRDAIERMSSLGNDLGRAIVRLPGMAGGDRSTSVGIRGGAPDETQYILDGLAIEATTHLDNLLGFSSIIDAKAIDTADLMTSGFPAEYGGRLSGVVELSSADPTAAPCTSFGVSSLNASFLSEGRVGDRSGWLLSSRAWYPDAFLDIVDPGGEGLDPVSYDLLGKVQTRLPGGTILSAHLLAARDGVDSTGDAGGTSVVARNSSEYAWLNVKSPWTPHLYSQSVVSLGRARRVRQGVAARTGDTAEVSDERSFATYGLTQDWSYENGEGASLKWGCSARHLEAGYDYAGHAEQIDPLFTGGLPLIIDRSITARPSGTEYGGYVESRLEPLSSVTLALGARFDHQTLTRDNQITPRVELVYVPRPSSTLRLGWGRYVQPQEVNELQVEDGVRQFFPVERAELMSVRVDHAFPDGSSLSVGAYDKEMSHLRPRYENLLNPIQSFPEMAPDRVRVAPTRSRAAGLELLLSRSTGRPLGWWVGYAFASVADSIDGQTVPRSWDQRNTFNFGLSYRRGDRWDLSIAGVYHSGWPTTAVGATLAEGLDGSLAVRPILGPVNAERYPPFHRLDMRVIRHIGGGRGTLNAFVEVANLYGRENICCASALRYLPGADGTVRVERDEGHWLRQIPSFGLTWEFGR